jgi:hypothetical protein
MLLVGLFAGSAVPFLSRSFDLTAASASKDAELIHPPVSALQYRLDPSNPRFVQQLRIHLGESGASYENVSLRLNGGSGAWIDCHEVNETWVCPVDHLSVRELAELELIGS